MSNFLKDMVEILEFLTQNKNLVHLSPRELNKTLKKEKKFLKEFKILNIS